MMEDDLEILDFIENGFPRRYNIRENYYQELDNKTFFQRFRLTKPTVLSLVETLEGDLEYPNDLNNSVNPMNQVLMALRYYATGAHLAVIADFMGTHPSTACRIVKRVTFAIAALSQQHSISMPVGEDELLSVQRNFFQIASFPRVAGCIDGTHIRIQSPGGQDAEIYRNRKNYFSINTQVVGDAKLKIRDIVARWPGSTHDSTIYRNSRIHARMENLDFPNCVLLGDSGYMLTNNFLTPIHEPRNREEQLYNESHIRTRNSIERLFGVWKRRFPILALGIRLKLQTTLAVIVATAVLNNLARNMNEPEPPPEEGVINQEDLDYLIAMGDIPEITVNPDVGFNVTRNTLVNEYFRRI